MTKKKTKKKAETDAKMSVETLEAMPQTTRGKGTATSTLMEGDEKKLTPEQAQERREENDLDDCMRPEFMTVNCPKVEIQPDSLGNIHVDIEKNHLEELQVTEDDYLDSVENISKNQPLFENAKSEKEAYEIKTQSYLVGLYSLAYHHPDSDEVVVYDGNSVPKSVQQFEISACRILTLVARRNADIKKSEEYKQGKIATIDLPASVSVMRSTLKGCLLANHNGNMDTEGRNCNPDIFKTFGELRTQKDNIVNRDADGKAITVSFACRDVKTAQKDFDSVTKATDFKDLVAVDGMAEKRQSETIKVLLEIVDSVSTDKEALK